MPLFDLKAHEEISAWRQEAKDEDNARYFLRVPEVDKLRSGEASFLIDRKGKGKTAVGQSILLQREAGDLATSLSFKDYPFNDLYRTLADDAFGANSRYMAGWQFVILCAVGRLMAGDARVEASKRKVLEAAFAGDVREALYSRISRWVGGGVQVAGYGASAQREFLATDRSLAQRAALLGEYVGPELRDGKAKYYVVFDELDEDYTSSTDARYLTLLTCLLRAARQVRQSFPNVYPVVLLRDDIFGLLRNNDREKLMDYTVRFDWSPKRIEQMLAFRLCRAARADRVLDFETVWREFVGGKMTFAVNGRTWNKFEFISSYTMERPRDYIYYLSYASRRICQRLHAGATRAVLSEEVLRGCVGAFAQHLRRELEDEMVGRVPYIHDVMDIVLSLGERQFKATEFTEAYERASRDAQEPWAVPARKLLDILYQSSAIGFVRTKEYFHYQQPDVDLDQKRTLLLHKGLYAARRAVA